MANGGLELEKVLRETIKLHSKRKGCRFRDDAADWLMAQPEWDAFVNKFEEAEIECAEAV